FLLGAEDEPGPLQKLLHVINRDHQPIIQAGSPVNLRELLSRYAKNTPNRQARVVRLLLRRYLYRESHVIRGPRIRSYAWSRRLVMDHPDIKNLIQRVAKERNKSEEKIRREVEKTFRHIAARFSFRTIKLMGWVCRFIWSRIYPGIDIGEEDLDRIRDAIRKGTPILIPSHRSHLDYLLLSSVCYENGLVLPHIVAGENLAFPPLGTLFRRCGAFFIRRSFKDEDIFPVVFQSYLRLLMRDEFPIEFFIEGGRSRSGKLLYPKIGVLGMIMDTVGHIRANRDILILPISISYEKIAEEKSYAKELAGTSKTKESVKGVLKATSVLLKRFGKVYIRVDEPISLKKEYTRLPKTWDVLEERQQKEILMGIAEKIIYGIGKKMLILPTGITAMALLSVGKRGVRLQEVQERAGRFDELLRAQGASSADSLSHGGWVVIQALNRFLGEKSIQKIEDEKGEIIRIEDDSRVTLEYYKNGLMHFVGHISMVASALLVEPDTEKAEELFLLQHYLLRYEFFSDPSTDTETLYREILPKLVDYGALEKTEDGYRCISRPRLKELAGLTQNFLESYLLTLRAASGYRARDISRKELPKKIQEFGKARLAIDEIVRPESLSIANIKNAIRAYREESILQFSIDGSGMKFDEKSLALYCEVLERLIYKSL
ncbi:MAG: 1-acyl-sn-glycerol-3-phosphate acyltransferase, partial [Myxococcota bacterium]|nr:1-acyl-sn-glycerol-3-phosphate acyltransferase [Myxococcota bacterium]